MNRIFFDHILFIYNFYFWLFETAADSYLSTSGHDLLNIKWKKNYLNIKLDFECELENAFVFFTLYDSILGWSYVLAVSEKMESLYLMAFEIVIVIPIVCTCTYCCFCCYKR